MGFGLNAYVRRLLTGEEALVRALQAPLLVWEQAAAEAPDESLGWMGTLGGQRALRPRAEEPLVLEVVKAQGKPNPLSMGVTVGRTANNDLVFPDSSVSRFHAFLQQDAKGGWRLVDAESRNGTWIGALKVAPSAATEIPDGARLKFGDIEVTFLQPKSFLSYLRRKMGEAA